MCKAYLWNLLNLELEPHINALAAPRGGGSYLQQSLHLSCMVRLVCFQPSKAVAVSADVTVWLQLVRLPVVQTEFLHALHSLVCEHSSEKFSHPIHLRTVQGFCWAANGMQQCQCCSRRQRLHTSVLDTLQRVVTVTMLPCAKPSGNWWLTDETPGPYSRFKLDRPNYTSTIADV